MRDDDFDRWFKRIFTLGLVWVVVCIALVVAVIIFILSKVS